MTEAEMRLALFGPANSINERPMAPLPKQPIFADADPKAAEKRKASNPFIPKLRVTLRVGNEFEGITKLITHDSDTLSTLQAELDATKIARKKYKFIEVVSVAPVK